MNYSNNDFLVMIDKCFNIKKTTFYDWLNNDDITNADTIFENLNNNKLINYAVETFIINLNNNNKNIGIKILRNKLKIILNLVLIINQFTIFFIKIILNIKTLKKLIFIKII
jgi:hypothetical protein